MGDKENVLKAQRMAAKKQSSDGSSVACAMTASMSAHNEATAEQYNNLNWKNPEEHAISSRACNQEFVGPEHTPTPEHLEESRAHGRAAEVILDSFSQCCLQKRCGGRQRDQQQRGFSQRNVLRGNDTKSKMRKRDRCRKVWQVGIENVEAFAVQIKAQCCRREKYDFPKQVLEVAYRNTCGGRINVVGEGNAPPKNAQRFQNGSANTHE